MANPVTVQRKPVASTANGKKVPNTRICGFEAQTVATFIFQLVGLIIGLVFGAWAIKSYDATLKANDLQASVQHALAAASGQLAVADYCQRYGYPQNTALCDGIIAALPLENVASAFFSTIPPPPATTLTPTSLINSSTSLGARSTSSRPTIITVSSFGATSAFPSATLGLPTPQATAPSAGNSASSPSLGLGPIVAIIVGGVAFVGVVIALIMRRLRVRGKALEEE